MAAMRRTAIARRQIKENGVSVDDFSRPGNPDTSVYSANGIATAIALPTVADGIGLWWISLDRPREEVAALARTLSSEEIARARRFGTDPLRERWIAGRATLRALLGRILGIAPEAVRLERGRRGRPQLAQSTIDFNVSHTRGMALVGIAPGLPQGMRIGVDVEHGERRVNADGLSRKFLSAREQAALAPMTAEQRRRGFLRLWTCKEAMSKATGDALSAPFRHLDIVTVDGPALAAGPPPYLPDHWSLHEAPVPDGYMATVAVWRANAAASP